MKRIVFLLFILLAVTGCSKKEAELVAGPAGATGLAGAKGDKGDTGATGAQGETGAKGDAGATGAQGPKGDTGASGPQGSKGDKGDKGDTGAQGLPGLNGADGKGASIKIVDATAEQCPAGGKVYTSYIDANASGTLDDGEHIIGTHVVCTGEKGNNGDKGDKGDKGDNGNDGSQGAQGNQGDKGDKGDKGDQGNQGGQGAQGNQGDKGDKGDQGNQGIAGLNGHDGKGASIASDDATPEQCDAGGTVYTSYVDDNANGFLDAGENIINTRVVCNGEQGLQGSKGDKGDTGAQGVAGNGSTVFNYLNISQNSCQSMTDGFSAKNVSGTVTVYSDPACTTAIPTCVFTSTNGFSGFCWDASSKYRFDINVTSGNKFHVHLIVYQ